MNCKTTESNIEKYSIQILTEKKVGLGLHKFDLLN